RLSRATLPILVIVVVCPSRSKRCFESGRDANSGDRTLMATVRFSPVSRALYTCPRNHEDTLLRPPSIPDWLYAVCGVLCGNTQTLLEEPYVKSRHIGSLVEPPR